MITISTCKNGAKYGNRSGFCNCFLKNKYDNVVVEKAASQVDESAKTAALEEDCELYRLFFQQSGLDAIR